MFNESHTDEFEHDAVHQSIERGQPLSFLAGVLMQGVDTESILSRSPIAAGALLLLALAAALAVPAAADSLDDHLVAEMESRGIPGLAFAVVHGGEIIDARAYGYANLETRTPAHVGTVWAIGSITKSFTAIALMSLAVEGTLDLDAPLSSYVDPPNAEWGRVTLRQLVGNASGIADLSDNPCDYLPPGSSALTRRDVLLEAACLPLGFEPGHKFEYSNTNFHLLADVIEAVTETPFEQVVMTRVVEPLGLVHTRFLDEATVIVDRADGYRRTDQGYVNEAPMELLYESAPGGLLSTVPDLARFVLGLARRELLPAQFWDAAWTPFPVREGRSPYGLGFGLTPVDGRRRIGHSGAAVGFASAYSWFPEQDVGVVVLSNGYQAPFGRNVQDLANRIAERYFED